MAYPELVKTTIPSTKPAIYSTIPAIASLVLFQELILD
jgi:hypothetical protein